MREVEKDHTMLYQYGEHRHRSPLFWSWLASHYPEADHHWKPIHVFVLWSTCPDPFDAKNYFPVVWLERLKNVGY